MFVSVTLKLRAKMCVIHQFARGKLHRGCAKSLYTASYTNPRSGVSWYAGRFRSGLRVRSPRRRLGLLRVGQRQRRYGVFVLAAQMEGDSAGGKHLQLRRMRQPPR
jgi:hypothetical protein